MTNPEREAHIRPPVFDGNNFTHWKIRTTAYLQSLGAEVWGIVEGGYKFPSATPTDPTKKKKYELNAKAVTVLLSSLTQSEFMKIMHFKSTKEIWDKIVTSYEGDDQVKRAKLQTLRIRYETLKMRSNESIANYFLRMDEIVNCMRDLGEEFEEVVLVEKVLRSLSAKFDSKVSAIEEKENVQKITMSQLHGILTAFEMRQEVPSEAAFEVSEEEYEVNFVKNLERGTGRFKGKLPFKCFLCGRVGHYAARCPHNKGKIFEEDGESSSQGEARNSNEKSEMLNKEQPRKEIPQGKSFTPNYERDRRLFPPLNNVECYVCHNLGHVAARCRSRMVQDHHKKSSHPRLHSRVYGDQKKGQQNRPKKWFGHDKKWLAQAQEEYILQIMHCWHYGSLKEKHVHGFGPWYLVHGILVLVHGIWFEMTTPEVWGIVEGGYKFPSAIPTDATERKQYELNAKAITVLLGSLTQLEFMKVMHFKSAKEMWDKIILSYEGDEQVKRAKLQTLRIRYENLKMHSNESIANYFLHLDEIVNCMRNLGEEFKEFVLVEFFLRSLSAKFDSKVSAIEEKENMQKITMSQLHEILTAFEMRKEGTSEAALKASGYMSEEEDEVNFVKNLERGTGGFKGKLPFKCFSCGRVGHYVGRCPHNKGKMSEEGNRSYYSHVKSNESINGSEEIRSLMAYDKKNAENEEVTKLNE
eukprot:PITA_14149